MEKTNTNERTERHEVADHAWPVPTAQSEDIVVEVMKRITLASGEKLALVRIVLLSESAARSAWTIFRIYLYRTVVSRQRNVPSLNPKALDLLRGWVNETAE